MPDKPVAQLIRELSTQVAETVAMTRAWTNHAELNLARVEAAHTKMADALKEVEKKLAAIDICVRDVKDLTGDLKEVEKKLAAMEERLNEVKRIIDETGRRRFTLFQGILCVFLGGVLAFLFQVALTYIQSRLGAKP